MTQYFKYERNGSFFIGRASASEIEEKIEYGFLDLSDLSLIVTKLKSLSPSITLPINKLYLQELLNLFDTYFGHLELLEQKLLRISLNQLKELMTCKIPNGLTELNFPHIFIPPPIQDFPPPWRKVMCKSDICDICNQENIENKEMNAEWTDQENVIGWFYCNNCSNRMIQYLQQNTMSIWHLRDKEEVKIKRSAKDENGNDIIELWKILSWVAYKIKDKNDNNDNNVEKYAIKCGNYETYKLVPIDSLLELNPI